MSSEVDIEAVPGLPHDLPHGERVIWQGKPEWMSLARQAFRVRWLAAYFALFGSARLWVAVRDGHGALGVVLVFLLAATCLGVLTLFAWLYARTSIYTVTTERIVMRIGVALPMTWNLPFSRLAAADLKLRAEGDGDIVLQLKAPDRIAWLQLWPHVAPWYFLRARPALRAIADPKHVAAVLAEAVTEWSAKEPLPAIVEGSVSPPYIEVGLARNGRNGRGGMGHAIAAEAGQ
jgi:hypothetical protein